MHAKPDLRVLLKWLIASSGSVIADVGERLPPETNPSSLKNHKDATIAKK